MTTNDVGKLRAIAAFHLLSQVVHKETMEVVDAPEFSFDEALLLEAALSNLAAIVRNIKSVRRAEGGK